MVVCCLLVSSDGIASISRSSW